MIYLFIAAIHQKLESDGTEKVEGSMTQRLENILNSKCSISVQTKTPQDAFSGGVFNLEILIIQ